MSNKTALFLVTALFTWKFFTVHKQSCRKVMFLHLSVSHSVHRVGACPSACWDAHTSPRADTHPLGRHPMGRHPQSRQRCYWNAYLCKGCAFFKYVAWCVRATSISTWLLGNGHSPCSGPKLNVTDNSSTLAISVTL